MSLFSSVVGPHTTLLFCAIFTLFYMILSFRVIYFRLKDQVPLGHKPDMKSRLFRAIRIHANFNEYIPLFLIILGLMEMSGINRNYILILGWTMVVGRILHVIGLERSHATSFGRFTGSFITFSTLIMASILILIHLWR